MRIPGTSLRLRLPEGEAGSAVPAWGQALSASRLGNPHESGDDCRSRSRPLEDARLSYRRGNCGYGACMQWKRRLANRVSLRSRQLKVSYFDSRIPKGSSVLIVGVSGWSPAVNASENLIEKWMFRERDTIGLAYDPPAAGLEATLVRADATQLPFADNSFDFVVSNAVIEHVGGPVAAKRMLEESRRVSRIGYLHTTPNRRFLIETHMQLPLLHWAPRRFQDRLFALAGRDFPLSHNWLFTPWSARQLDDEIEIDRVGRIGMTFVLRSG